ncbi:MAG: hypothetical protein AB7Q00_14690 [Phycisphaerales bacterium]
MDSITNLRGVTFTVGQRVHYRGVPCTIRVIKNYGRGEYIYVDFDPADYDKLPPNDYWKLNEKAAHYHGRPDYCRPRDSGASMGCFDEGWE